MYRLRRIENYQGKQRIIVEETPINFKKQGTEKMTTEQLSDSEVAVEQNQSNLAPEKFQFVLRGEQVRENEAEFLQLENGDIL